MLCIAWTTVETLEMAERLAKAAVESGLAACVQIEGPIQSVYLWKGALTQGTEFRLTFKCLEARITALEELILGLHPYEIPEWLVVKADRVAEKYLSWATPAPTSSPL